jgi:hypothetical protein
MSFTLTFLMLEADVVAGASLGQRLVVHLGRLELGGEADRGEGDDLARLDDAGLDTTHRHCADTSDFVDILRTTCHT